MGFLHVFAEIALICSVALVWLGASSAPCLRQWDLKSIPNRLKITVWAILGRPLLGEPSGASGCKKRSHAAWRSFRFAPEHSHAAWRSFFDFVVVVRWSNLDSMRASKTCKKTFVLCMFRTPSLRPCWTTQGNIKNPKTSATLHGAHFAKRAPRCMGAPVKTENERHAAWERFFSVHLIQMEPPKRLP